MQTDLNCANRLEMLTSPKFTTEELHCLGAKLSLNAHLFPWKATVFLERTCMKRADTTRIQPRFLALFWHFVSKQRCARSMEFDIA